MNFKLNDTACGFSQKHRQLVGPAPISIQARQVKGRGKYIFFLSLLRCSSRSDQGRSWQKAIKKNIYIFSQIITYSSFILAL
jgi:ketosteroid isomerase-like protein